MSKTLVEYVQEFQAAWEAFTTPILAPINRFVNWLERQIDERTTRR